MNSNSEADKAIGTPPLLVFGPRSESYDFGPSHPLTPRRFGTGISLLEALGAAPGLAPEPATDDELAWVHAPSYIETVKRLSNDPFGESGAGLGPGDTPAFAGMHEASAAVAGGSLRAMEAILRGDVVHAFHPGGGLHHAMPDRASGFCVYDDPALAIARARRDGLRVLYIDLDVHHGDGVQAIHWADPGVMTVSIHETGLALFPGTGFQTRSVLATPSGPRSISRWIREPGSAAGCRRSSSSCRRSRSNSGRRSSSPSTAQTPTPSTPLRISTSRRPPWARPLASSTSWPTSMGGRPLAGDGRRWLRCLPRRASRVGHVWLAASHRAVPDEIPETWRAAGPTTRSATASHRCRRPSMIRRTRGCRTGLGRRDRRTRRPHRRAVVEQVLGLLPRAEAGWAAPTARAQQVPWSVPGRTW